MELASFSLHLQYSFLVESRGDYTRCWLSDPGFNEGKKQTVEEGRAVILVDVQERTLHVPVGHGTLSYAFDSSPNNTGESWKHFESRLDTRFTFSRFLQWVKEIWSWGRTRMETVTTV